MISDFAELVSVVGPVLRDNPLDFSRVPLAVVAVATGELPR